MALTMGEKRICNSAKFVDVHFHASIPLDGQKTGASTELGYDFDLANDGFVERSERSKNVLATRKRVTYPLPLAGTFQSRAIFTA